MADEAKVLQSCNAVIFDLDDTLIGTLEAYRLSMPELLGDLGLEPTPEMVEEAFKMLNCLHTYRLEDLFSALLRNAGVDPQTAFAKAMALVEPAYTKILSYLKVLPGAGEFLVQLSSRGLILALMSNGFSDWQRRKLVHCGLEKFFPPHRQIVSGDLPRFSEKPSLGFYWVCLSRLGLPPEKIAFIGDRASDILGANIAGMVSVMVGTGRHPKYDPQVKLECPFLWVEDLGKLGEFWFEESG